MRAARDTSVETLRGLAILLVVAGHVIGNHSGTGMRVEPDSGFRYFYDSLQFVRMPLFTVISGWVYSLRPVTPNALGAFTRGKLRRLGVPLVVVGTVEFLTRALVPGVNRPVEMGDWWRVAVFPEGHFWFLQAILIVLVVGAVADRFRALDTPARLGLALAAAVVGAWSRSFASTTEVFSFDSALYLLPFFVLGLGIGRFPQVALGPRFVAAAAGLLVLGVVSQQASMGGWGLPLVDRFDFDRRSAPAGLAIGLSAAVVLFRVRWTTGWLARIGAYSYTIYLFHVFGTAAMRLGLDHAGVGAGPTADAVAFVAGVGAGVGLPVVVDRVLRRWESTRVLMLGLRAREAGSVRWWTQSAISIGSGSRARFGSISTP